tara:strand:- start:98 stop:484 length:387 start_codon:yes stop_codon:yes gene_type:complete
VGIKDTTYLKKLIFVDVDGTICTAGRIPHKEFKDIPEDYLDVKPFLDRIKHINSLYDDGKYTIVYWTARGCKSGLIDPLYDLTKKQLKDWGAKFHDLQVGNKPHFDMYICDKSFNSDVYFADRWLQCK